jgi:putative membrane protein
MRLIALCLAACAMPALAHTVGQPAAAWGEFWALAPLLASGLAYAHGLRRLWRSAGRGRGINRRKASAFFLGWAVLCAALLPPLDPLGARLFSAHMVQHELLMLVAAPLIVAGRPLAVWGWALPGPMRTALPGLLHRPAVLGPWHALTSPFSAWALHALALWAWHLPSLFTAALESAVVHAAQHLSFLLSATLFWWALMHKGARGMTLIYLFSTMLHTGALGALLVVSRTPWYPVYGTGAQAWGLSPLADQQLGGLIMWVPGGLVYVAAAVFLAARWLDDRSHAAWIGRTPGNRTEWRPGEAARR